MKHVIKALTVISCFSLTVLSTVLSSCEKNSDSENTEATKQVGIILYDESDVFLSEMIDEAKTYMANGSNGNINIVVRDAANSQNNEDEIVKEFIDEGVDVLCVNLVDRQEPSTIIDDAKEADTPVIFFNREPVEGDLLRWDKLYYVGADAAQSGEIQGKLAADAIKNNPSVDRNNDGKIQYVILEGEPDHQDAVVRTDISVATLSDEGVELDKVAYRLANWKRSQAKTQTLQLIEQYGSGIELILANNDEMALGAIDAYRQKNFTETDKPLIFGIDGTEHGLDAVVDGSLAGTVYNDKESQARELSDLAVNLAFGKTVDTTTFTRGHSVYCSYFEVTTENAGDIIRRQN